MENCITIIDGLVGPAELDAANDAWPAREWQGWFRYNTDHQRKSTCSTWCEIPPPCRYLLSLLTQRFTGSAIADTSLWGAGMASMYPGDFLHRHLDHDIHPHLGLRRAFNVILFLKGDGDLFVGDNRIRPAPGRAVKFDCTEQSLHEVGAVTRERRTLSVYFYDPIGWMDPATAKRSKALFVAD